MSLLAATVVACVASAQTPTDAVATTRVALQQYVEQYRRSGLDAVREAVASDRMAGRHEGLFVRVLGSRAVATLVALSPSESEATTPTVPSACKSSAVKVGWLS